jgi:DNA modification methylase
VSVTILEGDARDVLATLPAKSVQCCVTSPPYFGLRDYGHDGQIGLEATPDAYVAEMVALFREVWKVLRDDGTLWLNLGDSYARTGGTDRKVSETALVGSTRNTLQQIQNRTTTAAQFGAKEKDLLGIPWRVAFALQADGWYLRSDIVWHKPNPMPESVTDRPTKAHEYVFLLTKSARYLYDAAAIAEPSVEPDRVRLNRVGEASHEERGQHSVGGLFIGAQTRNARSVWSITTRPFKGAHFATMPPELAQRCILAGSRMGDTVLDPFGGAGTTGLVADRLGRDAVLVELNPTYAALARERIAGDAPLFYSDGQAVEAMA